MLVCLWSRTTLKYGVCERQTYISNVASESHMQGDENNELMGVSGLLTHRIAITDNNDITLELTPDDTVTIGSLNAILSRDEFTNGTYVTENNVEIDVRTFIENMRVDGEMAKALTKTRPFNASETHPFTERLTLFYGLLYSRLTGHKTSQSPPNKYTAD